MPGLIVNPNGLIGIFLAAAKLYAMRRGSFLGHVVSAAWPILVLLIPHFILLAQKVYRQLKNGDTLWTTIETHYHAVALLFSEVFITDLASSVYITYRAKKKYRYFKHNPFHMFSMLNYRKGLSVFCMNAFFVFFLWLYLVAYHPKMLYYNLIWHVPNTAIDEFSLLGNICGILMLTYISWNNIPEMSTGLWLLNAFFSVFLVAIIQYFVYPPSPEDIFQVLMKPLYDNLYQTLDNIYGDVILKPWNSFMDQLPENYQYVILNYSLPVISGSIFARWVCTTFCKYFSPYVQFGIFFGTLAAAVFGCKIENGARTGYSKVIELKTATVNYFTPYIESLPSLLTDNRCDFTIIRHGLLIGTLWFTVAKYLLMPLSLFCTIFIVWELYYWYLRLSFKKYLIFLIIIYKYTSLSLLKFFTIVAYPLYEKEADTLLVCYYRDFKSIWNFIYHHVPLGNPLKRRFFLASTFYLCQPRLHSYLMKVNHALDLIARRVPRSVSSLLYSLWQDVSFILLPFCFIRVVSSRMDIIALFRDP